ncbi:MAG: hypothetical protein HY054_15270, partial [Proteobacteria bacterium]|nr:hypothetical protein [Pseudomonadota bacterium]
MKLKLALAAVGAVATCTLLHSIPAFAQQTSTHVEECTTWGFIQDIQYQFGVVNTCSYPIEVWFLSGTGAQAHAQVSPGGIFSTGLT